MNSSERLIVALDRSDPNEIVALADRLAGMVGYLKLGLQAFVANGPDLVREMVKRGTRVFLDLKLHDIPNTVAHAVEEASKLGVSMLTIHAAGGGAMMSAAARAAGDDLLLLAVTILTSLDQKQLAEMGVEGGTTPAAVRLAKLAAASRVGGVVSSPLEIGAIRSECGKHLRIVTPGIRATSDAPGDQARTASAREAIAAGADYIVIGRPITSAADPAAAVQAILATLD